MTEEKDAPAHWSELTEDQRRAIIRRAEADIFWHQAFQRLTWLKGAATIAITLFAFWSLFNEALAGWLQHLLGSGR